MEVYTRHEHTNEWGVFPVSVVRPGTDERWIVKFDDGREFVGTFNHPVMVDGKWVQRPTTKEEQHFILPLLQEFDGGTLKAIPFPGEVTLNNK